MQVIGLITFFSKAQKKSKRHLKWMVIKMDKSNFDRLFAQDLERYRSYPIPEVLEKLAKLKVLAYVPSSVPASPPGGQTFSIFIHRVDLIVKENQFWEDGKKKSSEGHGALELLMHLYGIGYLPALEFLDDMYIRD